MTAAVNSIAQDFRCKADCYSAKLHFLLMITVIPQGYPLGIILNKPSPPHTFTVYVFKNQVNNILLPAPR